MICSRIQIELLSKTVDPSIDWASCGLLKTRLPPCTGPPLGDAGLVGDPLVPQPAMRARAEPAMRVFMRTMRCLTDSSRGKSGRRLGRRALALRWFDRF